VLRGACCLLAVCLLLPTSANAQVLQRTRAGTHDSPSPPHTDPPASSDSQGPAHKDDGSYGWGNGLNGEGVGVLVFVAAATATSPFWVPHLLLRDSLHYTGYFPAHPFALGPSGYMRIDRDGSRPWDGQQAEFGDCDYLKPWALRLALEDGNDFRGLNRAGGRLTLDTATRFGLTTNWNYFHEGLGGGHGDDTVVGDLNLTYRFAQCSWLQMHTGAGVRLLADRQDTRAGFNFLYGTDLTPIEPVVISTLFEIGHLDNALVLHGRATVGYLHERWELFGGYDFLRIGSVNLQGPLLGVRLWF
jgi:hypothetical protein